jgi:sporulation protein YlmC with PRC-barrel domain
LPQRDYRERRGNTMKKSTTLRTLISLLSCLFISFVGWAVTSAEAAVSAQSQQPSTCGDSETTIDLKTGSIANSKGVEIGAVKDFVLDLEGKRIAYIVGSFDQAGELSNRVFVLPWGMVKVDLETSTFTLREDKAVLESAPSFALDTWTNLPTSQWTGTVTAYWKERLGYDFAADTSASALYKAGDLVGMTIKDIAGKDVGTIEELMLDPEMGSIAYAVLSFQDTARSSQTVFFALPWNLVQVNPVQHTFVANVDTNVLSEP